MTDEQIDKIVSSNNSVRANVQETNELLKAMLALLNKLFNDTVLSKKV